MLTITPCRDDASTCMHACMHALLQKCNTGNASRRSKSCRRHARMHVTVPCLCRHSGGSSSSAGSAGAGSSTQASVPELLAWINSHKVTRVRPRRSMPQPASDAVCLVGESSGRIKWIQPSGAAHLLRRAGIRKPNCHPSKLLSYVYDSFSAGPRRPGEGTEDEEQGIVSAEQMTSGYDYRMPSHVRQQGV